MFEVKAGVKEPHPLQKPQVPPKLKMAWLGQGKQRPKTTLPFHKAGEKPSPPSAKIRIRCWSHQILCVTAMGPLIIGTIRSLPSIANMAPAY